MPVLPDVASTIVSPGRSFPDASPSAIIRAAARSFTEPPGFCHSAFAYNSTPADSNRCRRTSGVLPISSRTDDAVGRAGALDDAEEGDGEDILICDRTSPNYTVLDAGSEGLGRALVYSRVFVHAPADARSPTKPAGSGITASTRRVALPMAHLDART